MTLISIIERLDRHCLAAVERCGNRDPSREKEINIIKHRICMLICVGLAVFVLILTI